MIDLFSLNKLIKTALEEDMGLGDITTSSTVPKDKRISGNFIAKADGVLCGMDVAKAVFAYIDEGIVLSSLFEDGQSVTKGDIIATIEGNAAKVLIGERLALNLMQRMSGIATNTSKFVAQIAGTGAKILDTRKTTPGLRLLEKYAVRMGGGYNHRFSLSDGVLIKDNHIKAAGGISNAIEAARENVPHTLKIEIEVESMDEVKQAIDAGADIIMLDNMTNEQMRKAIEYIDGRALTEASGNMDEKDLAAVAQTGVDFISIGALTNSIDPLDISLKFN
jgi:nicotinate-nucleotide pyrophosphorylase (carboxylating)